VTVAYIINQYPSISHTFIRREIQALERSGMTVRRFTIRRARAALVDPVDIREASATSCLLEKKFDLLLSLVAAAVLHPLRFAAALTSAVRLYWAGGAGLGKHLVYLAEAAGLAAICRRERIAHLHAHFGTNPAAVAMLCHRLGGPAWSFTVHGPEEFDRPLALGLPQKLRDCQFAVAISEFGRGQLLRWARAEDWQKIQIVHCGLDAALLEAAAVPFPTRRTFVCVARLCEQKGHQVLLAALDSLQHRFPDNLLTLVGDGPLRPMLEERVKALGLEGCVVFAGSCSGEQVRQHIQAARVMILPSFAEGLPVVLMEAFALGRPVIATAIAGVPELVNPGQNGWLVPAGSVEKLAEAMSEALTSSDDQLGRMAAHGSAAVRARHDAAIEGMKIAELFLRAAMPPAPSQHALGECTLQAPLPLPGSGCAESGPEVRCNPNDLPLIVNVSWGATESSFLSNRCSHITRWKHVPVLQPVGASAFIFRPFFWHKFCCFRAALCAVREGAALVVTHDPYITFDTGLFLTLLRYRGKHLAFSFNYPLLPTGMRRRFHSAVFRKVDRFVVYSVMEKVLYQDYFGLPAQKVEFVLWGADPPSAEPADRPVEPGQYMCAIGGNARDYDTLMKVMENLPELRLVMVARRKNLVGLRIPTNVAIYTDVPIARAMNILAFSRFMVLPLSDSKVPCGHVTLVLAMHLGKPVVITRSKGVEDYVQEGVNALTCEPRSPATMVSAIRMLWNDQSLRDRLGSAGKALAEAHCTEAAILAYFIALLKSLGVART